MPQSPAAFRVEPILVARPWGGRALARYGKRLPHTGVIAESWEIADLPPSVAPHVPTPSSQIVDGPWAGSTLGAVVRRHPTELLGDASPAPDGGFPLLVKLLDAREHLSVQVHPSAAYVADHPTARVKTESWYIIEAGPDSVLYLGLRDGVDRDDLRRAIESGTVPDVLQPVDARQGDFHHLPSGLVHALGAGVIVAEVQTPSDTTFRLYDWTVEYGRADRPMHVGEALAGMELRPAALRSVAADPAHGSRLLVDAGHYAIAEHRLAPGRTFTIDHRSVAVTMVVAGAVSLGSLALESGATAIVPAAAPPIEVVAAGEATMLEITVP